MYLSMCVLRAAVCSCVNVIYFHFFNFLHVCSFFTASLSPFPDILLSLLTFDSSSLDYASLEELAVYQQTSASQPGGPTTVPQTPPTVTGPASSAAVTKPQQLQVGGAVKRGGSVLPSPLATNSFAAPKSNQNPLLLNSDLIAKAW